MKRSKIAIASLMLTVLSLSSCMYPGDIGYGYGGGMPVALNRYVSAYSYSGRSMPSGHSGYGYRNPARHSPSYGVQHSFGQSFVRSGHGGGFSAPRHGGGHSGGGRRGH